MSRGSEFFRMNIRGFAGVALVATALYSDGADEPIPEIDGITFSSNSIALALSNLNTGGTYYVEHTGDLFARDWTEADSFEGAASSTNWSQAVSGSTSSLFYRVVRDPYSTKVGQRGELITRYHDVTGTARIVNNRTIALENFNFDGAGLDVVVFISPNPNYEPGISISDNLVRSTPYVNTNMTFSLPEGYDLNDARYISIWCIDIPVSFGDGVFE